MAAAAAAWTGPLLAWAATAALDLFCICFGLLRRRTGAVKEALRVRKHQVTDREKANGDAAQYEMLLLLFSLMC